LYLLVLLNLALGPAMIIFLWQRRGVVNGIDYGFTGEVKKIEA
jgi:hypothetical protein